MFFTHSGRFPARLTVGVLVALLTGVLACAASSEVLLPLPTGAPPKGVAATRVDLDNRPVQPFPQDGKGVVVLVFVSVDCPICQQYAPEIQRLADGYARNGVSVWLVQSPGDATVAKTRKHLREFGYRLPLIRDVDDGLARWVGATVVPECAVYVPGVGILYRGRIDDRYVDFGKSRTAAKERDLAGVLDALARGERPKPRTTRAVGCFLPR